MLPKMSEEKTDTTIIATQSEGIQYAEAPKSRPYKKYVIIAVSGLLAVAIILTAILVGMHLFTEAQKDILRFSYNRDVNTKEEVTSDPNANVVQYHVTNTDYEAWVINDFNRDIQAMKIRWVRGTNCFLTPLNRTTADDPSAIKPPSDNQPTNATYMLYYRSANTPVADSTFLGQTTKNACNGLSTYWLFPVCEGSESTSAKRKRRFKFFAGINWGSFGASIGFGW